MQEYYKFINEPLPYSYKAMEPFIDIQTMYLHHDKHLQTYVDNLNRALRDYPFLQTFTLEQLLCNLESMPMEIRTQIRNNAGGVYNHRFYFNGLSKEHGQRPQGELAEAIDRQYGSYEKFKEEFMEKYGTNVEVPLIDIIDVNNFNGLSYLEDVKINEDDREKGIQRVFRDRIETVSYTHLTLPTIA